MPRNVKTSDLKQLLLEELANKKVFEAHWTTDCYLCGNDIEEDDSFYFFGDKKKVCADCKAQMEEVIETV